MLYRIINKEDRGVYFYDGSAFMRRHAYSQRSKARTPAPITKGPVVVDNRAVPHSVKRVVGRGVTARPRSAQSKIGRYKGGSTARAYDSSYHSQTNKAKRRRARVAEGKRLKKKGKRKSRYSQLM